jgi:hypothetical protein
MYPSIGATNQNERRCVLQKICKYKIAIHLYISLAEWLPKKHRLFFATYLVFSVDDGHAVK